MTQTLCSWCSFIGCNTLIFYLSISYIHPPWCSFPKETIGGGSALTCSMLVISSASSLADASASSSDTFVLADFTTIKWWWSSALFHQEGDRSTVPLPVLSYQRINRLSTVHFLLWALNHQMTILKTNFASECIQLIIQLLLLDIN